jgi:hypothetical protein
MAGVILTDTIVLDFLQGLYDIYQDFKDNKIDSAAHNAEVLAKLLIAAALEMGDKVIEELLAEEFSNYDIDNALKKLIDEENND